VAAAFKHQRVCRRALRGARPLNSAAAGGAVFINPYAQGDTAHYLSYFVRDDPREANFSCAVPDGAAPQAAHHFAPQFNSIGTLNTFRLAVAATAEYTAANGGTVASAIAAINTRVMGINAVFNREMGIRLILIADEERLIYTDPNNEPYTSGNKAALIEENQAVLTVSQIDYDIGHVFDGGNNGGQASVNSVCNGARKGKGTSSGTALGVYVHEMGHQFGATHTFNDNTNGGCVPSEYTAPSAYEPGSGSTIMAYEGLCGSADVQLSDDLYFHAYSLLQMSLYLRRRNDCFRA
jgi:hypothetical protein